MKNFLFLILFLSNLLTAQTIPFSDAAFKSKLLQSDASSRIARNLADDYFAIDANQNGEIEIDEASQVAHLEIDNSVIGSLMGIENFTNLVSLQCGNNQISNLNIGSLTKLTDLNCNNNSLKTLVITGANQLQNLNCQSNQLVTLDLNNVTNLLQIDCSDNKLTSVNLTNLINLESLICSSNFLTSLNLDDLVNLVTLECNRNAITSLNFSKLVNIESLNCNFNKLSSLDIMTLIDLKNLDCSNNQLDTLKVVGLSRLSNLNCNNNLLTALDVNTLFAIVFLYCTNNKLQTIQVAGLANLKVLDISKNQIGSLVINGLSNLQNLYCSNNKLVQLDATNQIVLQSIDISNNLLTHLFIKNGSNESFGFLLISGNPNLNYICADESEVEYVQEQILMNGYTNCFVSSYCSFVPGGNFYTIEGDVKLDSNRTGCDVLDRNFPNLKLTTTDGANTTTFNTERSGSYSFGLKEGSYIIQPVLENPTYYTISPASSTVTFPSATSPFLLNYCVSPNGNHSDLEISLLPLNEPKNNYESNYVIVYKNKGTVTSSGLINLTFDSDALDYITASPNISSQEIGILKWNFTNLQPQEIRTVRVSLIIKPSINIGYDLKYSTSITNVNDETPGDNSADLNQIVANSENLNDKICLEGNTISPTKVGDYLHYMIRFENSGASIASNIVVKDLIDISKLDINTLVPIIGSHPFTTTITNNDTVEFIFQNIDLPFQPVINRGYVAFKIKTGLGLVNGNEITNAATIYFDSTKPLTTNTVKTNIGVLSVQDQNLPDSFFLYPNPVTTILNIVPKTDLEISSITIFNALGQLVQTHIKLDKDERSAIDVSQLKKGIYFMKILTGKESSISKFIKN